MNRCYSLPTPPTTLTDLFFPPTLPSFTVKTTSFYVDSTVYFVEDADTKTTVDI